MTRGKPRSLRRGRILAGGAGIAVAGVAVWIFAAAGGQGRPEPPRPVSTVASNLRACLLGDGGNSSSQVWQALRADAGRASVNAQQMTEPPRSQGDPGYINSLVQQRCALVLAVGDDPSQAALSVAGNHPEILFAVTAPSGSGLGNVKALRPGASVADDVSALLAEARTRR